MHASAEACLEELERIHQFVYRNIGDEILWCASMPCNLPADDAIPIGRYGSSNSGRLKTVYRIGLAWRYGRRMQTISGIHYNFSLPGDDQRELLRADPQLPAHVVAADLPLRRVARGVRQLRRRQPHELQPLEQGTLYLPHATSLRMGRLGYQSDAQATLAVSYNSLASYGASLYEALTVPYPPYEKIGIQGPATAIPPARHQPAADRERVLHHHPRQAPHAARRAAAARAARARRRVRRSAR